MSFGSDPALQAPGNYPNALTISGQVFDLKHIPPPKNGQFQQIVDRKWLYVNLPQLSPPLPTFFSAPGDKLLTPAQIAPWSFIDVTASNPGDHYTFPTAAAITAAFGAASGNATGSQWYFNISNDTANTINLVGNTGVVLTGINAIAKNTEWQFILEKNNNNSYNIQSTWLSSQTNISTLLPLTVPNGGTGDVSFPSGAVLYGNVAGAIQTATSNATATNFFLRSVSSGAPVFAQVAATDLSGTLPVANGGTGGATFTQYGVIYGNLAAGFGVTAAGTTGQFFGGNTGGAPTWQTPPTVTFPITVAQGGTGNTGPFQLGDTWSGGGAGNPAVIVSATGAGDVYTSNGVGATPSFQTPAGYTLTAAKIAAVGTLSNDTTGNAGGLTALVGYAINSLLVMPNFASPNPIVLATGSDGTIVSSVAGVPTWIPQLPKTLYSAAATNVGAAAALSAFDAFGLSLLTPQSIVRISFTWYNGSGPITVGIKTGGMAVQLFTSISTQVGAGWVEISQTQVNTSFLNVVYQTNSSPGSVVPISCAPDTWVTPTIQLITVSGTPASTLYSWAVTQIA